MSEISAKCGHVTRQLNRDEPLTEKVLEFALSVIDKSRKGTDDDMLSGMANKLKAGQQLSDYESHFMVDVLLVHKRTQGN